MICLTSHKLGLKGESLARDYLLKNRYTILHERFKTKYGEIDIICKLDKLIVFAEIKTTKRDHKNVNLNEIITQKQIKRNINAAEYFLSQYKDNNGITNNCEQMFECRFDLILITNDSLIYHIEGAWSA